MRKRTAIVMSAVIAVALLMPVIPAHAGGPIAPSQMLANYYSLINSRNFAAAYNQWVAPTQTYENFVAGYADTSSITSYFGGFQSAGAGQLSGGVPSVLVGYRYNGTVAAYRGCYFVSYDGSQTGFGAWRISGADIQPLEMLPTPEQMVNYLDFDCYERISPSGYYTTVQQVLVTYYDAINRGDYLRAYNLWANPVETYANFSAGFADTTEAVMFYGNYQFGGSYNMLETGRIPVYLFGYRHDGSVGLYQGCFGVNFNATRAPFWWLVGANLREVTEYSYPPTAAAVQQILGGACY